MISYPNVFKLILVNNFDNNLEYKCKIAYENLKWMILKNYKVSEIDFFTKLWKFLKK